MNGDLISLTTPRSCGSHIRWTAATLGSRWRAPQRPDSISARESVSVSSGRIQAQHAWVCISCSGRSIVPQPTLSSSLMRSFLKIVGRAVTRTSPHERPSGASARCSKSSSTATLTFMLATV